MKYRRLFFTMTALLLSVGIVTPSEAVLNAVDSGPYTAGTGFFPLWYQDTNGIALEPCLSNTPSPGGTLPMCNLPANPGVFDPALPISFPNNFPDEAFWFTADARARDQVNGVDISITIALEAAFATGAVVNGDQTSFARIRIRGTVDTPGVYVITHPYGVEVLEAAGTGTKALNYTRDIGIGNPGDFTGALGGDIGPFLVRTDALGNVSPVVIGAETFVGDPNDNQTVTGSPFGTNYLRVQGPGGVDVTSDLFGISGKVFTGTLPTPIVVARTSYSASAAGTQMDIFAISPTTAAVSFTDSALPPHMFPMGGDAQGNFFGQAPVPPSVVAPVTISATATPFNNPAFPANSAGTKLSQVTDLVSITKAEYSIATQTLVIEASSSDQIAPPALNYGASALAMTLTPPVQRLTVTGLVVPPAEIMVTSSAGGLDTEEIVVLP